jgi:Tol biopolymer transport system component
MRKPKPTPLRVSRADTSSMPRLAVAGASIVTALLVALSVPSSARSTVPGRNGLIAFVTHTYSADVGNGIAVVRADGHGFRKLTRDRRDRSPAWSPDGSRLVFERGGQLYVINRDGTGLRRLTRRPTDARQPAWSPSGREIAFTREASGALWLMRADGSGRRVIYRGGLDDTVDRPAWSPDGRRIAFGLREAGWGGSIAIVKREGGAIRYVTDGRPGPPEDAEPGDWPDDHGPDWSPDGRRIVFTRVVWLCPQCDYEEIFSASPDGADVQWVTTDTSYPSSRPSWSPDGTRIVAETIGGIAVFDATGKRLRSLNRLGTEPTWQPLRR